MTTIGIPVFTRPDLAPVGSRHSQGFAIGAWAMLGARLWPVDILSSRWEIHRPFVFTPTSFPGRGCRGPGDQDSVVRLLVDSRIEPRGKRG